MPEVGGSSPLPFPLPPLNSEISLRSIRNLLTQMDLQFLML